MSAHSEGEIYVPFIIRLQGYDFALVESLSPERDAVGAVREFSPQGRYAKAGVTALHKHGHGTYCRFRISVPKGMPGVYALVVAGAVCYIGECEDLAKRFNMGYGNISPKNCYVGGQTTNCKINRHVLDLSRAGGQVDLYFHPTPLELRKPVEKQLVASYLPLWNG